MIEIEIRDTLLIEEKDLVECENLTLNSTDEEIAEGVYDFIIGMDDADYFVAIKHEKEICEKIKKYLKNA